MHAEQKRERLGGLHFENERDHQGESGRPADPREQADAKAKTHADQHQAESFPLKHQEETVDECVEHRLVAFTAATEPGCETEDVIGRQTPARLYGSSDFTVKQRFVLSGEM